MKEPSSKDVCTAGRCEGASMRERGASAALVTWLQQQDRHDRGGSRWPAEKYNFILGSKKPSENVRWICFGF